MDSLPFYIYPLFIAVVLATLLLLYIGTNRSKPILLFCSVWLTVQGLISIKGFYYTTSGQPRHFPLLVLPAVASILLLCFLPAFKGIREKCNPQWLTWLHTVRIGVELVLFILFTHKLVPKLMTFEGGNLDIISGLTAPLIVYFGYNKKILSTLILLAWNLICLCLLFNIVIRAILSAPFPFQKFGFDQPNMAIFQFPFVWLPGFIVPVVLFCHLITIQKLLKKSL
jgi:hypothetical protein